MLRIVTGIFFRKFEYIDQLYSRTLATKIDNLLNCFDSIHLIALSYSTAYILPGDLLQFFSSSVLKGNVGHNFG
jgi:hypothetical protein